MDSKVNYTVVGLFVVVLSALLFIAGLWLSIGLDKKSYHYYRLVFQESVSGLNTQAAVNLNGVEVGYVETVKLNLKNPKEVNVLLAIEEGIPITESTEAMLQVKGLTGIPSIGLSEKDNGEQHNQLLKAKKGERYPEIKVRPSLFFRLDSAITDVAKSLKEVSGGVTNLLSNKNQVAITQILQNFALISSSMLSSSQRLDTILDEVQISTKNISLASNKLPQVVDNINRASASINQMAIGVNQTTSQVKVALEGFSGQALPETINTLQQVQDLLINLQQLTQELEQNPSALIRGRTPQSLGPGE